MKHEVFARSPQKNPKKELVSERARRRAIERALHARRPTLDEFTSISGYAKRLERQRELAFWLWDHEFDWLVTINSNDPNSNYKRGRQALKKFDALIDRYFLGKHWCKIESGKRTLFFAVPEHGGGELHYHILLKFPRNARRDPCRLRNFIRCLSQKLQCKRIFSWGCRR